MSSSDFNALLDDWYKPKQDSLFPPILTEKLYDEYVIFHLMAVWMNAIRKPSHYTKVIGNQTNLFEDGLQLGAIYFVANDNNNISDWWFVVGYYEESMRVFYGEMKNGHITSEYMDVWNPSIHTQPLNNFITESSIIQSVIDYFISDSDFEIFIAYSPPPSKSKSRTLNFSRRGFL